MINKLDKLLRKEESIQIEYERTQNKYSLTIGLTNLETTPIEIFSGSLETLIDLGSRMSESK